MITGMRILLRLVVLLILTTPVIGPTRAGNLEPFLQSLASGEIKKHDAEAPPLIAWDRQEAASNRARVLLVPNRGVDWVDLRAEIHRVAPTCRWEGHSESFAQAVLDFDDLEHVSKLPELLYVMRPPCGVPMEIESEGLAQMEVPSFQNLGYGGDDVRIGVLDLGFAGYEALLGTELPGDLIARSFFGNPDGNGDITGGGEEHGTACAEIIHDIAPGATIYIANAQTPVELQNAVNWMLSQNVAVISHSVGWYFGGLDGTGPLNEIAESAIDGGVVWVNAAGNEADRHTWTNAIDADQNELIEFDGDEEIVFQGIEAGETLTIVLLWNSWPRSSSIDFDIEYVVGSRIVATSAVEFNLYPFAFRFVEWTAPTSAPVAVRVRHEDGSLEGLILHLFRIDQRGFAQAHRKADRSLLPPADSRQVLTVGAVDWRSEELESYSSRGSLNDEPIKPEICGPVGVSTAAYGTGAFRGTSAAAPHVAGAVALLAGSGPSGAFFDLLWDVEDLRFLLAKYVKPAPWIEPLDWGIVRMPSLGPLPPAGPLLLGNPARGSLTWQADCPEIEIVDLTGRIIAHAMESHWDGRTESGRSVSPGIYWTRCPGEPEATRLVWLGR